jgi:hypothetical protein
MPRLGIGLQHAHGALLDGAEGTLWPGLRRRGKLPFACCCSACWRSRRTTQPATPSPSTVSTTPTASHSGLRAAVISTPVTQPKSARCAAARPARAPPMVAGRSWTWRLQRSTRHRAGMALAGRRVGPGTPTKPQSAAKATQPRCQVGFAGAAATSEGPTRRRHPKERAPRGGVAASPPTAKAAGRPASLQAKRPPLWPAGQHPAVDGEASHWEVRPACGRVW